MKATTDNRAAQAIQAGGQVLMTTSTRATVGAVAGPVLGELAGVAVNHLPPDAKQLAGGAAIAGAATGLKVAVAAKLGVAQGAALVAVAASGFGLLALGIGALIICIADDD